VMGILLFLVLVAPWFILSELRNPGFLNYFFVNENFLRFVKHDYGDAYGSGHLYRRGSALLMFLAATAPWCLFAFWRVVRTRTVRSVLTLADKQASFLFLGFAVGTLFWCLARQLLTTYLLPMVPLFAAWLAMTTPDEVSRKRIFAVTTALVAVMAVASIVCVPFLRNTSTTREIVEVAYQHYDSNAFYEPLVFGIKTPYSALFYARGWVVPHPKETLQESIRRCGGTWQSVLVIIHEKQKAELQRLKPERWKKLATAGKWMLVRVAVPAPEL